MGTILTIWIYLNSSSSFSICSQADKFQLPQLSKCLNVMGNAIKRVFNTKRTEYRKHFFVNLVYEQHRH